MTEEQLDAMVKSGEYRRIGPFRHTGYIAKGVIKIYPYFGRHGDGWLLERHASYDRRRHEVLYYVRRI